MGVPAFRNSVCAIARASLSRGVVALTCALFVSLAVTSSAFGQALANYTFTPGWATFGLALPQGAAVGGVKVGNFVTQTDVKTLWPDGSIRFAVVTANIDAAGTYPIVAAARPNGSVTPATPWAMVTFNIGGTAWTASLPAGSTDYWLSGPLVNEARTLVAPTSGGSPHPFLRVLFDVRTYAGGGSRVDVTVQNTLDVASADRVTYDVAIGVAGSTVFTRSGVNHPFMMRWRKIFWTGGTESLVTPDFEPAYAAQALPRYMNDIHRGFFEMDDASFDILRVGGLLPDMSSVGGRPEIAPYPDWAALYLVAKDPYMRNYVLRSGDLAGSWSVHITKPDGVSLISIDEQPHYALLNWYSAPNKPANNLAGIGAVDGSGTHQLADNAHQPSLAYIPYLLTGDRYYADEMAYWANYVMLIEPDASDARQGSLGLLQLDQPRGIAWGLRNMTDAAAYLPDSHPYKTYFRTKLQNNLSWADQYAVSHVMPLNTVFEFGWWATDGVQRLISGQWQNDYVAWAIDHAHKQGFAGGDLLVNRIIALQLRLFNSPEWPRAGAAPYYLVTGTRVPPADPQWYTTLSDVYNATAAYYGPGYGGFPDFAGAYGLEARTALLMAIDRGMPDAQGSMTYLMSQPLMGWYIRNRPGWAIDGGILAAGTDDGPRTIVAPRAPEGVRVVR